MQKFLKLNIVFFALILFLLMAKNADAAVLQKAPNNLGLVGYWSFNEGTSTIALDYSGNKNKGTLTNGPTWVNGKQGKALNFDGSNDKVVINSIFGLGNTNITIANWVYINSTSESGAFIKVGNNTVANNDGYAIGVGGSTFDNNGNDLILLYEGIRWIDTGVTIGTGWHHVAMAINSSGVPSYFIDGSSRGSSASTNATAPTAGVTTIGGYTGSGAENRHGSYFIDDVRIYNRALTPSEVEGLYNVGAVKYTPPNNLGLVGYWSFNEGTSTIALDYSGNKNKGTLVNGPTWVNGKQGKALSFDGSGDKIVVPHNDNQLVTNGFTISAWIYPRSAGGFGLGRVVEKATDNNSTDGYGFFMVSNTMRCQVNRGTGRDSGALSFNQWTHVVCSVSSGATVTHYINGAPSGTPGTTGALSGITTTNPLLIGESAAGSRSFNGLIDDVRIYNRALSAGEIKALYNVSAVKYTPPNNLGLVGYWSFNEGTSTVALDYSGNKNKGTLVNGPTWVNGKQGKALSFDGVNDYVNMGNVSSLALTNTNFTLSVWAKWSANNDNRALLSKYDSSTNNRGWALASGNTPGQTEGIIQFLFQSNAGAFNANENLLSSATFNDGKWHHIVGVFTRSTSAYIYVDGVVVASDTTDIPSSVASNSASVEIGSYDVATFPINASLDDVRIYNRALSADEVLKLYNSGK